MQYLRKLSCVINFLYFVFFRQVLKDEIIKRLTWRNPNFTPWITRNVYQMKKREVFSKSGTLLINNACYQLSLASVYLKMCVTLANPVIAKFVHNALAWSSFFQQKPQQRCAVNFCSKEKIRSLAVKKNWPSSTFNYRSSFTDRSVDEGNNTTDAEVLFDIKGGGE